MARRKTAAQPAGVTEQVEPGGVTEEIGSGPPAEPTESVEVPGSEEVQVMLPAPDEPVRRGGWVLTDNGWQSVQEGSEAIDDDSENEKE